MGASEIRQQEAPTPSSPHSSLEEVPTTWGPRLSSQSTLSHAPGANSLMPLTLPGPTHPSQSTPVALKASRYPPQSPRSCRGWVEAWNRDRSPVDTQRAQLTMHRAHSDTSYHNAAHGWGRIVWLRQPPRMTPNHPTLGIHTWVWSALDPDWSV